MTQGFTHSGVLLALLGILCICLGIILNCQDLKTFSLRPRPCSPCPVTTGRWHLREKCNGLLVKVLAELRKTGFNSWLCNGSSSWPWATTCALVENLLPHAKLFWDYLLILDRCCARALLQRGRSVGSRLELRVRFESRAIYHADEPQFLPSFTSSFYTSCNHFMHLVFLLLILHVYLHKICPCCYRR